ncbi:type I pantothenate kinase [Actinomadura fibrosa]|uniref:Pantothenate kinase n=1 Tax=Actinomadura fibrosa TaxID=111802 RepID=A0ABW2XW03_9ACTN|nr:type I pantothenate kinase [Actinomadura fibrosa]
MTTDAAPTAAELAAAGDVAGVEPGVAATYVPVARRLARSAAGSRRPFVVGIAGGVAVGKSATARILARLLRCGAAPPRVEIVDTDGFLLPNRELQERGVLERKGFPETYDAGRAAAVLDELRRGAREVSVPVYSHRQYDIVPGAARHIRDPDIVLVEGVYVATLMRQAPAPGAAGPFDLTLYLDAAPEPVYSWYLARVMESITERMQDTSAPPWPLTLDESRAMAAQVWDEVNVVNAREHIVPSRDLADLLVTKNDDHSVASVRLRDAAPDA